MSSTVNLAGRLTRDPELRYSAKGTPVATFAVVTSERRKDAQTGEWSDVNASFWDCVAFGQMAENVAESLTKGTAVLVQGRMYQEEYTDREGQKRRSWKVTADDVAPSLRWASAKVNRTSRSTGGQPAPAAGDPWATGTAAAPASSFDDSPPF